MRVTIDVGGTFTDCHVQSPSRGVTAFKSATTPGDPLGGVLDVLSKGSASFGLSVSEFLGGVDVIVHGTTLATNALLTKTGARVGMVTTEGFRDQVEARRGIKNVRTSMYDLYVPPYQPLVPRYLRRPIRERIGPDGDIITLLEADSARAELETLRSAGVDAVAVCCLHSHTNPAHEHRAAELARQVLGTGTYVAASADVLPVCGEYERFSTTVVSAYVGPIVARYLASLKGRLSDLGFTGELLVVKSDGLMQSAEQCARRAVDVISSGPAAAPGAALYWGHSVGTSRMISMDMGGTSFDVCLLPGDGIPTTTENWVGDERVGVKMVDVASIGAGGGSIASLDALGLLQVGPRSAGADPGPACYGRGGREPTVTDADLLLGYIPVDNFLGGEMPLDVESARAVVGGLGAALDMDEWQMAEAIFATVNTRMADTITEISTKCGRDIRDYALVAGGGAGPVHAAAVADLLGASTIVVPAGAGLYSAFGMLTMDVGREYVRGYVVRRTRIDLGRVGELYAQMESEARADLKAFPAAAGQVMLTRSADMRYAGQFHEVEVPLAQVPRGEPDLEAAVTAFHDAHEETYHFQVPSRATEFVSFRLKAVLPREPLPRTEESPSRGARADAVKRTRQCRFGRTWVDTPCYAPEALGVGTEFQGPAVVEEGTTTVLIPPGYQCRVAPGRVYVLQRR